MNVSITILVAFLGGVSLAIYLFLRRQQQLWRKLGIPAADRTHILFGNVAGIGRTRHSSSILGNLYWEFKQRGYKAGGFMNFFRPAILIVDPDVVKSVLVRDFNVFHDRGVFVDPVGDPLSGGLFSLEGAHWRTMRQKLTPTFTSGKMKYMFGTLVNVAERLEKFVAENCHRQDLEVKNTLQRFSMDVIGSVAFGLECNTLQNENMEFSRMGNKALVFDMKKLFKFFVGGQFKSLARAVGLKLMPDDVNRFFMQLAEGTVQLRESGDVKRNHFMSLLLNIRNKGKLDDGEGITMGEIAAQCFVFFTAGFETSSTTMNFCLYELAVNPDIQDRLRREIEEAMAKDGGELKYETLLEMNLLDRVVCETLRKYPALDNLFRVSSKEYTIPETKFTVPAGTLFQIPIYALQHDPEYFPDPERFNPDRFLPAVVGARHPYTYLPFGDGPRNCIGLRFGLMQVKVGLVTLLRRFRFVPNSRTPIKVEFDPASIVLSPRSGMYLKIEPIIG